MKLYSDSIQIPSRCWPNDSVCFSLVAQVKSLSDKEAQRAFSIIYKAYQDNCIQEKKLKRVILDNAGAFLSEAFQNHVMSKEVPLPHLLIHDYFEFIYAIIQRRPNLYKYTLCIKRRVIKEIAFTRINLTLIVNRMYYNSKTGIYPSNCVHG